ncbi:hypothetical protein G3I40_32450 [Streptomyces sp. SID14478]|uniref:hypothetical protein n=1 Tax=Streptomyces sp. SID14478 TaxID=2706073 RepID=UPI0013D95B28|nr:hypothetical protein [Streptomyces sp. SID14478]NEB79896.1 hypothetical protein [Streptomyces sp. SID14478]
MDGLDGYPSVVVHAAQPGGRRVYIRGEDAGLATSLADVTEFLRRAGLEDAPLDDPDFIEWRGGGSAIWPAQVDDPDGDQR